MIDTDRLRELARIDGGILRKDVEDAADEIDRLTFDLACRTNEVASLEFMLKDQEGEQ